MPNSGGEAREVCAGDYTLAKRVLQAGGFDSADWEDIFMCSGRKAHVVNCEIVYNVAEASRLKAQYWKSSPRVRNSATLRRSF
jgi:hypothetical protein